MSHSPLQPLHPDSLLSQPKLELVRRLATEDIIASLRPGEEGALKVRPDGTIVDGHHRVRVLRDRGIDVDSLPRDILPREEPQLHKNHPVSRKVSHVRHST